MVKVFDPGESLRDVFMRIEETTADIGYVLFISDLFFSDRILRADYKNCPSAEVTLFKSPLGGLTFTDWRGDRTIGVCCVNSPFRTSP